MNENDARKQTFTLYSKLDSLLTTSEVVSKGVQKTFALEEKFKDSEADRKKIEEEIEKLESEFPNLKELRNDPLHKRTLEIIELYRRSC
jgi:signal transduction protein with GAF and PtsI domain